MALELTKGLAARGFAVSFFAPEKSVTPISWQEWKEQIEMHPVLTMTSAIGIVISAYRILRILTAQALCAIHLHFAFPTGLVALPLGLIKRLPIVVTSHGSDIQKSDIVAYGSRRKRIKSVLTRVILNHAAIHVVVSKAMVPDALAAGSSREKIRVIYPGVRDAPMHRVRRPEALRALGIFPRDFVILFLGRMVAKKAPEDLIKAAPIIIENVRNAKIIIAGDGPELARLQHLVADSGLGDRVKFPGKITDADKGMLLDRCNVFVIPSIVEGTPHALLEALAFGKPVVATNIPSFVEILSHRKDAILVPVQSPEKLADAVIQTAKKIRRISRAPRQINTFNIDRMVESYIKVYEEVTKASS